MDRVRRGYSPVGAREIYSFCLYLRRMNLKDVIWKYRGYEFRHRFALKGLDDGFKTGRVIMSLERWYGDLSMVCNRD